MKLYLILFLALVVVATEGARQKKDCQIVIDFKRQWYLLRKRAKQAKPRIYNGKLPYKDRITPDETWPEWYWMQNCMDAGKIVNSTNIEEVIREYIVLDPRPETGRLKRYVCFDDPKYQSWLKQSMVLKCLLDNEPTDSSMTTTPSPSESCTIKEQLGDENEGLMKEAIDDINVIPSWPFYVDGKLIEKETLEMYFGPLQDCYDRAYAVTPANVTAMTFAYLGPIVKAVIEDSATCYSEGDVHQAADCILYTCIGHVIEGYLKDP